MGFELDPPFDEAWAPDGSPRGQYEAVLEAVEAIGAPSLLRAAEQSLADGGVSFGASPFVVDPIPRIITAPEWHELELGLAQRARALNRFLLDAYGAQELVAAGVLGRDVIETAEGFEPELVGRLPSYPWPAAIIGFDLVRASNGAFMVLEDNLRTPSGFAYAVAARDAVAPAFPPGVTRPVPLAPAVWTLLAATLRAARPAGTSGDGALVVLTDGSGNVAHYEHALAADAVGAVLATLDDLVRHGDHLTVVSADGQERPIDVVYRRTNEDRIRGDDGDLTRVADALLEPWLRGRIGLVNGFGNGVADDKLVHSRVEDFIRFYLHEQPLIRSVPTTHVQDDPDGVLDRLGELVVKPRHGHGGIGVVIGPHADQPDLDRLAADLRADPTGYIAQPTISLSVHPTVVDGQLQPRHVDLRPFSFAAEEVELMPGGLSRVAFDEGALVVNSSQNGGGKDTWIMPADLA